MPHQSRVTFFQYLAHESAHRTVRAVAIAHDGALKRPQSRLSGRILMRCAFIELGGRGGRKIGVHDKEV